jgi:hypothetical protein
MDTQISYLGKLAEADIEGLPIDPEWEAALVKAGEIGTEHGRMAAGWYEIPDAETARRVIKSLEDGDPEIYGTFAKPPTGEYADDYTFIDLMRELGHSEDYDTDDAQLWSAYTDAWDTGYEAEVDRTARTLL